MKRYRFRNNQRNNPLNHLYATPHPQYPAYYPYTPYYVPFRNLPPVDPKMFIKSAKCIQNLMTSANIVVNKFASSPKFSVNIMTAAQFSNQKEVDKLIKSLGLKDQPIISYTPDGINIQFDTTEGDLELCHLTLKIRWG